MYQDAPIPALLPAPSDSSRPHAHHRLAYSKKAVGCKRAWKWPAFGPRAPPQAGTRLFTKVSRQGPQTALLEVRFATQSSAAAQVQHIFHGYSQLF